MAGNTRYSVVVLANCFYFLRYSVVVLANCFIFFVRERFEGGTVCGDFAAVSVDFGEYFRFLGDFARANADINAIS